MGLGSDYRDPTKYKTLDICHSRCRGLDLSDSPSGSSDVGSAGRWFHRAVVHRPFDPGRASDTFLVSRNATTPRLRGGRMSLIHAVPNDELITAAVNEFRV